MSILILNGSPRGKNGNCQIVIKRILNLMSLNQKSKSKHDLKTVHLSDVRWTPSEKKKLFSEIKSAQGFIFVTGTYWDSWGSPLQLFLENVTALEGTPSFLGKPAVVVVLNHSVGGKGVLSRLQGVLSTFGCMIPPMSGLVYSWVSDQILKKNSGSQRQTNTQKDLWSLADLKDILENFQKALEIKINWTGWPVDRKDARTIWLRRR